MNFSKDDDILIDYQGRTVEGTVMLASTNGKSLVIKFDAMIGGHAGMMPVTMIDDFNGYSIIDGIEITVRRKVLQ